MGKSVKGFERRQHVRYQFPETNSSIKTRVISSVYDPHDIHFIDFSYSGLGLISKLNIPVGTALDLEMSMDGEPPVLLKAIISNRRKLEVGYQYGAFFEYDAGANNKQVKSTLERVERQSQPTQLDFF